MMPVPVAWPRVLPSPFASPLWQADREWLDEEFGHPVYGVDCLRESGSKSSKESKSTEDTKAKALKLFGGVQQKSGRSAFWG